MPCMQVHHIRSSVPRYFLDLMYNTQSSYTYTPLLLATLPLPLQPRPFKFPANNSLFVLDRLKFATIHPNGIISAYKMVPVSTIM